MTLIAGLIAKDGIILASDSRMTSGDPNTASTLSNDTVKKVFRITDHCGIALCGHGGIGTFLIETFQNKITSLKGREPGVIELSEEFRKTCLDTYNEWFKRLTSESERIPDFSVLMGGYSKAQNGVWREPKIIEMHSYLQFAPMATTVGFATAGIPTIANYLLNRLFIKDEINVKQALLLATYCVIEAESQDGRVGGKLQAAVVPNSGQFQDVTEKEINKISSKCGKLLRDSFQLSFYKPHQLQKDRPKLKIEASPSPSLSPSLPRKDAVMKK